MLSKIVHTFVQQTTVECLAVELNESKTRLQHKQPLPFPTWPTALLATKGIVLVVFARSKQRGVPLSVVLPFLIP